MKISRLNIAAVMGIGLLSASTTAFSGPIPTPYEIHEYQQIKYLSPEKWTCRVENGFAICKNKTNMPLIAVVKAQYKREDWNLRTDTKEVAEHCIKPGAEIWAGLTGNMVIEPAPELKPTVPGDAGSCPK
ncbi:exported hypothetical protein [Crenothrix polyspora]|uniref:Uncharacterized protein n=1 Tax=Crenothrix polyspora TaxID=360316 RepID=A0A1R4H004_9GAMM|nr:hypothetical protein [Crenothrix polyspora]SJM89532.1 exported hypothetical protein [Crenothrix polyspora]